jgi:hypothetical protein
VRVGGGGRRGEAGVGEGGAQAVRVLYQCCAVCNEQMCMYRRRNLNRRDEDTRAPCVGARKSPNNDGDYGSRTRFPAPIELKEGRGGRFRRQLCVVRILRVVVVLRLLHALPASPAATLASGTVHCFLCHLSFTVSDSAAAQQASAGAFKRHVSACWAAHAAQPSTRALAVVCARAAAGGGAAPAAVVSEAVAAAVAAGPGGPPAAVSASRVAEDLAAALDPRLLRLKRLLLSLAASVDWSKHLRQTSSWPPAARVQWARDLSTARSVGQLIDAMGTFETALRHDDGQPSSSFSVLALGMTEKEQTDWWGEAASAALLSSASPSEAWLPPWYLESVPSIGSGKAVPTYSAAALRVHALAAALRSKVFEGVGVGREDEDEDDDGEGGGGVAAAAAGPAKAGAGAGGMVGGDGAMETVTV